MNSTSYNYLNDSTYSAINFTRPTQVYYIALGLLATIGNLYLVLLFIRFSKLRATQCNWFIIFLCVSDVFIGIGSMIKGIMNMVIMDNMLPGLNFYSCIILYMPFTLGYRVGQAIALLMAIDRFIAIWRPTLYAKSHGYLKNVLLSSGFIIIITLLWITFMSIFGTDSLGLYSLSTCQRPFGFLYFTIVPSYSGIISILFFVIYSASLLLFSRQMAFTKKQQAQAQKEISKAQMKLFISVSLALLCYSVFYVIPTVLQMLYAYLGLPTIIFTISTYVVTYGAELNGCINCTIYLVKHQEFKMYSKTLIYRILGKKMQAENMNTTRVIVVKSTISTVRTKTLS